VGDEFRENNNMKTKTQTKSKQKQLVVVRTINAGVHIGRMESRNGDEIVLSQSRRLWRWGGANTLNEVASKGVSMTETTRLSEPVGNIITLQVIEIIPVSKSAEVNLTTSRWM